MGGMSPTTLRNIGIVAALAAVAAVWQGASLIAVGLSQIILVLFVFAMLAFGYRYFKDNRLAWLVLSDRQRAIILGSVGIAVVVILGYPWVAALITPIGAALLIAACVVAIVFTIRESRRWR